MLKTVPFDSEDPFGELSGDFLVIRARAIQAYAELEQSMGRCFQHLADVTDQVAGVIFFKIVNSRSRIAILEKLKQLKHGPDKKRYFNSIMSGVSTLDGQRNKIVHWTQDRMLHVNEGEMPHTKARLVAPAIWAFDQTDEGALTARDILDFSYKCDVFERALNGLVWHWEGMDSPQPWLDIFEQALTYPIPEDHLLFRKRPIP